LFFDYFNLSCKMKLLQFVVRSDTFLLDFDAVPDCHAHLQAPAECSIINAAFPVSASSPSLAQIKRIINKQPLLQLELES